MADVFATKVTTKPDDVDPRCWQCGHKLARILSRPWVIDCPACKYRNQRGMPPDMTAEDLGAEPRRGNAVKLGRSRRNDQRRSREVH